VQILVYFYIIALIGVPAAALEEQPLEALRRGIDKVIGLLEDPNYQDDSLRDEQAQRLWEATQEIFDFKEFSRRVLASHWKKFIPRQRDEFVELMGQLLGKPNLRKLQSRYKGEKIYYTDQKLISKTRALVEIKVLWKNLKVPVTLRMRSRHGRWKVYDFSALGINAVGNYRAQLNQILQKKSPEEVIEIFKEKIRTKEKMIALEEEV